MTSYLEGDYLSKLVSRAGSGEYTAYIHSFRCIVTLYDK